MNKKILIVALVILVFAVLFLSLQESQFTARQSLPNNTMHLADVRVETVCTDKVDNDGDGLLDNQDGDCWIREGAIYRTHPVFYLGHSFKEITEQIPSIKDLGVKTILLAPFWDSPKVPGFGLATMSYHPLSYYRIDPAYGTEEDLKDLIKTTHDYDMKVMLDLVTGVAEPGSDWYEYGTFKIPLEELKKKYKLEYMKQGGYNITYYNRYKSEISKVTGEDFYDIIGLIDKDNNVVLAAYPNPKVGIATDRKNPKVIEYFEGKHEPIIAKKLFDEVQEVMKKKSKPQKVDEMKFFLYRGFFHCGECGFTITADKKIKPSGKSYTYYYCTKKNPNH